MRTTLVVAAALFTVGGAAPAALAIGIAGLAHAARSPDRLLDVAYAATFCAVGYLVG